MYVVRELVVHVCNTRRPFLRVPPALQLARSTHVVLLNHPFGIAFRNTNTSIITLTLKIDAMACELRCMDWQRLRWREVDETLRYRILGEVAREWRSIGGNILVILYQWYWIKSMCLELNNDYFLSMYTSLRA